MHLDLSDEESAALTRLLRKAIDDDRLPLSPRIRLPKASSISWNRRGSATLCRRSKPMRLRTWSGEDAAGKSC
jgi:hypothetical protein